MGKHQLCRNCGHEVSGNYCAACGQRTTTRRLCWGSLVESVTSTFIGDEAYGLRGINMRKGAMMTWLAVICRPHVAISEFIGGSRRKYFNPVAILLLLSTVYAVVFQLVGKEHTPLAKESQHLFLKTIYTFIDYAAVHPAAYILLALPIFALAMKTVFRRKADLRYVEYLYVGIFLSIFEITLMILMLPAELLIPKYSSFYMNTLPVFVYTAFVFHKLFNLKRKGAILRTFLVDLLHYVYLILFLIITLSLFVGCYYLVSPEKLKQELMNIDRNEEKIAPEQQGILREFFGGVLNALEDEDEIPEQKSQTEEGEISEQNKASLKPSAEELSPEKRPQIPKENTGKPE